MMLNKTYRINIMKAMIVIVSLGIQMCGSMVDDSDIGKSEHEIYSEKHDIEGKVNSNGVLTSVRIILNGCGRTVETKCSGSGSFVFSGLMPGKYILVPESNGVKFIPERIDVDLGNDDCEGLRFDEVLDSWEMNGETGGDQELVSVIKDGDDYIGVGSAINGENGDDIFVISFTKYGYMKWKKCFGGSNNEQAVKALRFDNNRYFILFNTVSSGIGMAGMNTGILEIDSDGNLIGEKTFGGYYLDEGSDIVRASDDSVLITGSTTSFSATKDIFVSGFDLKCDLIGYRVLHNDGLDTAVSLETTENNNEFMILGKSEMSGLKTGIMLIRLRIQSLDTRGSEDKSEILLCQKLVSEEAENPSCMIKTSYGEYCISGWVESMIGNKTVPMYIRINGSGEVINKAKYSYGSGAIGKCINSVPEGGFLISGSLTRMSGCRDRDAYVSRIGGDGEQKEVITADISTDSDEVAITSFTINENVIMTAGNRYYDDGKAFFVKTIKVRE